MKVTSLVVRSRPERLETLRRELALIAGVEMHSVLPEGRLVVTVDDAGGVSPAETIVNIHNLGGVIGVSLVYEYCDDETEIQEAVT